MVYSGTVSLSCKKAQFEMMQRAAALGVPMCQPVEFGICDEGVYSLQSWIEGKDAEEMIPFLSVTEQYVYGFEAGRILKKLHSVSISPIQEEWD